MRKLAIAALIAATLSAPLSVSAAQYECADGTILTTGTPVEKSHIHPVTGELVVSVVIFEANTPLTLWQKSECRLRNAKNLADAQEYGEKVSAYVSKWGFISLEDMFPQYDIR